MKKHKKVIVGIMAAVMSMSTVTAMSTGVSAAWVKYSDGTYSYKDDTTGKNLTGLQTINGGTYYFGKDGKALTGWKKIGGNTYYFKASDKGKAATKWLKNGDKQYYFSEKGVMQTGWKEIGGKKYYFGSDGVMRTGKVKINDTVYDLGTDGALKTGFNISDPMAGLEWGMTKQEIIKAKGLKNGEYTSNGGAITIDDGDTKYKYYTTGNKLDRYSMEIDYSKDSVNEFIQSFKDAGWKPINKNTKYQYSFEDEKYSYSGTVNQTKSKCGIDVSVSPKASSSSKSSSSSSSSKSKKSTSRKTPNKYILDAFEGVRWDMTADELIKAKNLSKDDYTKSGSTIIIKNDDPHPNYFYVFNSSGISYYGIITDSSDDIIKEYRQYFSGKWEYRGYSEKKDTYTYGYIDLNKEYVGDVSTSSDRTSLTVYKPKEVKK